MFRTVLHFYISKKSSEKHVQKNVLNMLKKKRKLKLKLIYERKMKVVILLL
jgi:hypothetical protein